MMKEDKEASDNCHASTATSDIVTIIRRQRKTPASRDEEAILSNEMVTTESRLNG